MQWKSRCNNDKFDSDLKMVENHGKEKKTIKSFNSCSRYFISARWTNYKSQMIHISLSQIPHIHELYGSNETKIRPLPLKAIENINKTTNWNEELLVLLLVVLKEVHVNHFQHMLWKTVIVITVDAIRHIS